MGFITEDLTRSSTPCRIAIHLSTALESRFLSDESLKTFILDEYRKLLPQAGGTHVELKQIQIPFEGTPLSSFSSGAQLSLIYLRDSGALAVVTEKPLNQREESLFSSIAHYLCQLSWAQELENEIQLRSQFLSIASHELKTPLTSIYGVLQLQERILRLKKDEPPEIQLERQHNLLKMVIRQVERLNELIDGLLDVSRIQNGRFTIEPADHDVALILKEILNSRLNVIAQEANVRFQLSSPASLFAWVDPVRMEELFSNLLMNAVRFSPEGGVIWLELKENQGQVSFQVRDQGPSVPIEDRERIFLPFERAQRTGRLGGLGLGLFISREIAQLHGGTVTLAESIPGKGNVFEANFPVRNVSRISA
jgi:signal transduction histidine kinase